MSLNVVALRADWIVPLSEFVEHVICGFESRKMLVRPLCLGSRHGCRGIPVCRPINMCPLVFVDPAFACPVFHTTFPVPVFIYCRFQLMYNCASVYCYSPSFPWHSCRLWSWSWPLYPSVAHVISKPVGLDIGLCPRVEIMVLHLSILVTLYMVSHPLYSGLGHLMMYDPQDVKAWFSGVCGTCPQCFPQRGLVVASQGYFPFCDSVVSCYTE